MFYLEYSVLPSATHPQHDQMGEGLVCCWIERPTMRAADRVARRKIRSEHWDVLECQCGEPAVEGDNDDEDWVRYYRQALIDKTVFVFNQSPRFPVYWIVITAARQSPAEVAEAHYFVSGETVLEEDGDIYAPDFWSADIVQQLIAGARTAILAEGWDVVAVAQSRPCGRMDVPEDIVFAYDEAEESGSCIVFVHDGDKPND